MEFAFDVGSVLPGRISVIESKDSSSSLRIYDLESGPDGNQEVTGGWTYNLSSNTPWDIKIKKRKEELETLVDSMGLASARAQNLHSSITTLKKLLNSSQQKIYTIRDVSQPKSLIGMLKVGIKRLFVRDERGAHHEVDPLCVLDFYVHESTQRCGFGHELFNAMLKAEGLEPEKLAVDRPSFKCLAFLEKHYHLKEPSQQNNNFVIYHGFLVDRPITRPPIFLYNEKVPPPHSNFTKLRTCHSNNNVMDSMKAFHPMQVPLRTSEIKSKTFYSSTGNFLNWTEFDAKPEYNHRKKLQDSNVFPGRYATNSYLTKEGKCWGVHDAMHSYSATDKEHVGWSRSSTNCALTPINSVPNYNQKKMNSLQSSWNVLGVKAADYSPLQSIKQ